MDLCPGTITVEYYDGSSEFSDSDDESRCPNEPHEESSGTSSSSSTQKIRDAVAFKTYDFKHGCSENDCSDLVEVPRGKIFSVATREAMSNHYFITHQEHLQALLHPKASFPRCPRGDVPEQYGRRKHPGPFLTCSFSHCHECGDDFAKIPIPTKPSPEYATFTRPQHLKEKKAKFFKQCKHCETTAFAHHRNPARHYEDYLNNVTYKRHNDHTKVWQQHVVDLMFTLGEDSSNLFGTDETDIVEKCKHYEPSESIVKATKYYLTNTQRRMPTVVTRRRTAIVRPLFRRPLHKTNAQKVPNLATNPTRVRPNLPEQTRQRSAVNQRNDSLDKDRHTLPNQQDLTARNARTRRKSKELHHLHPIRRSSSSGSSGGGVSIDRRQPTALHQRLKASITRLIKPRQASSKVSKRFVKTSEPPKEVKNIQRGKPNISARFLRARSRSKNLQSNSANNTTRNLNLIRLTKSGSKGGKSSINSEKFRPHKNGRGSEKSHSKHKTSNLKDDSSDDGSYAKFRDQNGEFDVEKYRQSILKMLTNSTGEDAPEKKKKQRKSFQLSQSNFMQLPAVKNAYRNVKPRITSNFTQRKRRKVRKPKRDSEFDLQIPSDISLRSKYWNDDSIDSKDSYFSIPSIHDLQLQ